MHDQIEILSEAGRHGVRPVQYFKGAWKDIERLIPSFDFRDFAINGGPPNQYLRSVIRKPIRPTELEIPVGVVSKTYQLVQHRDVIQQCFDGLEAIGIRSGDLEFELGTTDLGEWINLRFYLPHQFDNVGGLRLRLELFNSVDGSSRLVLLLGWLRLVCSNGMIIGETKAEFRERHNASLEIDRIPKVIANGFDFLPRERERLATWHQTKIDQGKFVGWIDGDLSKTWGVKSAARTYHICETGRDVTLLPFATGTATEKPFEHFEDVPGSALPAVTLFDVSQALSWVATNRQDSTERRIWQEQIPRLLSTIPVL